MSDETPDTPTPTEPQGDSGPSAEELLKELSSVKQSLAAQEQASGQLRDAFVQAVNATQRAQQRAPEPVDEPDDIPTADDFEEDHAQATARLAATMIKRGLSEYHNSQSQETASLRDAVLGMEWERVRNEDPKNFDRLAKHINSALSNSQARRPGAVRDVFYRLRGQYMSQLQEMDRQEAAREPVPSPNAPTGKDAAKKEEPDEFTSQELEVVKGLRFGAGDAAAYFQNVRGKAPNFAEGYLSSLRIPETN